MERYTLNISFKNNRAGNVVANVVESCKTLKQALGFSSLIDDTVDRALIKDNVSGRVIWLKNYCKACSSENLINIETQTTTCKCGYVEPTY